MIYPYETYVSFQGNLKQVSGNTCLRIIEVTIANLYNIWGVKASKTETIYTGVLKKSTKENRIFLERERYRKMADLTAQNAREGLCMSKPVVLPERQIILNNINIWPLHHGMVMHTQLTVTIVSCSMNAMNIRKDGITYNEHNIQSTGWTWCKAHERKQHITRQHWEEWLDLQSGKLILRSS